MFVVLVSLLDKSKYEKLWLLAKHHLVERHQKKAVYLLDVSSVGREKRVEKDDSKYAARRLQQRTANASTVNSPATFSIPVIIVKWNERNSVGWCGGALPLLPTDRHTDRPMGRTKVQKLWQFYYFHSNKSHKFAFGGASKRSELRAMRNEFANFPDKVGVLQCERDTRARDIWTRCAARRQSPYIFPLIFCKRCAVMRRLAEI